MVKKWKKLRVIENVPFNEYKRMDEHVFLRPDGVERSWYIRKGHGHVVVLAKDREENWILVRQYRQGVDEIVTGFVAGGVEELGKEDYWAERELKEEAGYKAEKLVKLGKFPISAGYSEGWAHYYLAFNCDFVGQELEEDEFIEVVKMTNDEFVDHVKSGQVKDVSPMLGAMLALDWLRENET